MTEKEKDPYRVTFYGDGSYHWVYEVDLIRNPMFFFLVWKIFFFIYLGIFTVVCIADASNWGVKHVLKDLPFLGYFLIGMTVVIAMGYLLYAAIMGGKYIVEFKMDKKGFVHRQIASQAEKARKLGRATMFAGAASGKVGVIGTGINAQRTEMSTEFARVKKVKPYPRLHMIKVNETLEHNQIYARPEDFEFVLEYILAHCPNLKE